MTFTRDLFKKVQEATCKCTRAENLQAKLEKEKHINAGLRGENNKLRNRINELEQMLLISNRPY